MRVLIISDTHGRHTAFDRAIMEAGKIDYLVHLGDTEGGEDYIEAFCGCPAYILAGNNDFFSRNLREMEIYFGKKKAFMAHGHQYSVSLGVERILDEGRSRNADIVMFGHTQTVSEKVWGYYSAESGQSVISTAGRQKRQLYHYGDGSGREYRVFDSLSGLE